MIKLFKINGMYFENEDHFNDITFLLGQGRQCVFPNLKNKKKGRRKKRKA